MEAKQIYWAIILHFAVTLETKGYIGNNGSMGPVHYVYTVISLSIWNIDKWKYFHDDF